MAHEFKRDNFTETEPHTHQQEFHRSGLPPALQPLTSQRRWVCWCWKWQEKKEGKPGEGKWTKPPIQAGAGYPAYARTDDPTTWSTYEAAVARVRDGEADGIGLCLLGANIGVADLDNCYVVETGAIAPWAQAIIDRAPKGTYCEISVSGTGLHLLGEATGKRLIRKYPAAEAAADDDVAGSFELFRNASRYITISGLVIHSASGKLTDIDPLLNELHTEGEERRTQPQQRKSAKQASARLLRKGKWTRGGMTIDLFNLIAEGVDEPSRSAQFFHAIAWLKRLDWTVEGITWLLGKHPNGIATKYTGRLRAEVERVYNKVEPDGDNLGDFFAFAPQHTFIELVSRKPWPAISIDNRLPMQALVDEDGQLVRAAPVIGKNGKPKGDPDGDPVLLKPSVWLDQNRSINGITWAPGMPLVVFDKVIAESVGWIDAPGKATFNTYRAPVPEKGDPRKAGPWLKLVRKVYGCHARRIVQWFAYRVQRPDVKINHGLVFGGVPGIGKDTIIEGVREAIGGWNIRDASPLDMFEKYNAYAKAVLLRINESRDTGEQSQHALYNKMKTYLAAPPPTLTVNEKYIAHDDIPNVCGGIITTNYKETGLFLPPEDRRNYMLWSERQPGDFKPEGFQPRDFIPQQANPTYWDWMWDWYESQNGYAHVAAYLQQLDISKFNAKAPPPKTEAFWAIVNANRSREENELAEVLLAMGRPAATTLALMEAAPIQSMKLRDWMNDSRNRRVIPKHMKTAGYESVHSPDSANGLWRINGIKQVIYAREELSVVQRIDAARALKAAEEALAAKAKEAAEDRNRDRMAEAARGFSSARGNGGLN